MSIDYDPIATIERLYGIHLKHKTGDEYAGPCPFCGGEDRFVCWSDAGNYMCRPGPGHCGRQGFVDELDGHQKLSADERRFLALERAVKRHDHEIAEVQREQQDMKQFMASQLWEKMHDGMGAVGRQYWEKRGIPGTWQDIWELGYATTSWWDCPIASIPIRAVGGDILNMKYRLQDESRGRYRYAVQTTSAKPMFICHPERDLSGDVIAVEGEIKSQVVFVTLDDYKVQVVGYPGTNAKAETVAPLKQADRVTIIVDPGATESGLTLAGYIGKDKCRIVTPQKKIDDAIIEDGQTAIDIRWLLKQAKKA